jgi:hypothetical protein
MSISKQHPFKLTNLIAVLSFLSLFAFFACSDGGKQTTDKEESMETKEEKKASNLFEVEGKVFSIPSPIQTAFLLQKVGANYQSNLLNSTENASAYSTTFSKAINLGVYGADLGYATIYNQSQDAISYMAVTKKMSNELGIDGLYDETMIKRFEQNIGNQDSLLVLVSDAFKKSDQYLKNNDRKNISVLILAGGWIETLHFATSLAQGETKEEIKNRIGEQKITIKNLINLILPYGEDEEIAQLINSLNELKDIYGEVEFTYTYKPAETMEEEKLTVINSSSQVIMTDKQLEAITAKVKAIRSDIIK